MSTIAANRPTFLQRNWLNCLFTRVAIAALLLSAAALKITDIQPRIGIGFIGFSIPTLEIVMACWILLGMWPRLSWWCVITTFAAFSSVSLVHGVLGHDSCGCFGSLRISPWWTLLLDLGVVALLIAFRWTASSSGERARDDSKTFWPGMVALLALSGSCVTLVWSLRASSALSVDGMIGKLGKPGTAVIIDPETWVGRPFPLVSYVDSADELVFGRWRVALVHYDCPKCQELIQAYKTVSPGTERLALVQLPPHREALSTPFDGLWESKLTASHNWIVTTPVEITLDNGRVVAVSYRD